MTLKEIITLTEEKLKNPDLTQTSREREETHLHYHKSLQRLLAVVGDEMMPKPRKRCWRYGDTAVEQCSVCESCLEPGDLAWNEGEE